MVMDLGISTPLTCDDEFEHIMPCYTARHWGYIKNIIDCIIDV